MKSITMRMTAILMVLLMVMTAFPAPVVGAQRDATQIKTEIDTLEEEKAKIDAQISGLQVQIDANMTEIEKIVAQKDVIDQQIALLYDKMRNINEKIAILSTMILEKQEELTVAEAQLEELMIQYKDRIRAMEENGNLTYWEVIFQANSFADLLDRLHMIEEINRSDRARLKQISKAAEKVKTAKADLEEKMKEQEQARTQLQQTQAEMQAKQAEADALLQQLLNRGEEYRKYIEEQEKKAAELEGQINEKEGLLDELEKEAYDQWQENQKPENGDGSSTGSNTVNGVTWIVPINYTAFTSPYGYRDHPLDGDWRMHNGVDLAAPMNTPIYASRSGVVYYRGWWGSGGNTIMINHQDGYISRYLHMESFAVSNGEWVAAGQIIGYCGTSGGSNGPHLHFEIQKDGVYVNPADYINI